MKFNWKTTTKKSIDKVLPNISHNSDGVIADEQNMMDTYIYICKVPSFHSMGKWQSSVNLPFRTNQNSVWGIIFPKQTAQHIYIYANQLTQFLPVVGVKCEAKKHCLRVWKLRYSKMSSIPQAWTRHPPLCLSALRMQGLAARFPSSSSSWASAPQGTYSNLGRNEVGC